MKKIFTLGVAWKTFPLVKAIATDIAANATSLKSLNSQRESEKDRRKQWDLDDEIKVVDRNLHANKEELRELSVKLLDAETGKVGYRTIVNNQEAYFTWKIGEQTFSWQFVNEENQRDIPKDWLKEIQV